MAKDQDHAQNDQPDGSRVEHEAPNSATLMVISPERLEGMQKINELHKIYKDNTNHAAFDAALAEFKKIWEDDTIPNSLQRLDAILAELKDSSKLESSMAEKGSVAGDSSEDNLSDAIAKAIKAYSAPSTEPWPAEYVERFTATLTADFRDHQAKAKALGLVISPSLLKKSSTATNIITSVTTKIRLENDCSKANDALTKLRETRAEALAQIEELKSEEAALEESARALFLREVQEVQSKKLGEELGAEAFVINVQKVNSLIPKLEQHHAKLYMFLLQALEAQISKTEDRLTILQKVQTKHCEQHEEFLTKQYTAPAYTGAPTQAPKAGDSEEGQSESAAAGHAHALEPVGRGGISDSFDDSEGGAAHS